MALGSPKGGRGLRCAPQPSSGAVTGKREPRLNCIKRQSATLPGARASGETPPSAQANFGRGPTLGAVQKTVPAPCPCCGFVRLQTHSPWASKHSILSSLWNVPLQEGTQGPKEASPARGARSPRRPERRTCKAGVPPPGGCGHRDPRYTHRCGAPREAGRGRSVPVGPRTRPVGPQLLSAAVAGGSWGTSPAQGRCLAAEKAVPTRPAKKAGTPALRSAGRGGPPPPSAGYPQRLPRRRQLSLQPLGLPLPPPPARGRVAA